MEFLQPGTWAEALQMKAAHPQAVPVQGGTDVMVELNFDRYRPEYLLDLTRVSELRQWAPDNGRIRLGAGLTYTHILTEPAPCYQGWRWHRGPSGHPRSATGERSAATSVLPRRLATRIRRC